MSNFTFTITVSGQTFDKTSAEVAFIQKVVDTATLEFSRGRGTVTSGNVIVTSPTGVANTSLGSWSFTTGASHA